nr:MAG TPA: hypothetical protein [Caudoviricetes sp.]
MYFLSLVYIPTNHVFCHRVFGLTEPKSDILGRFLNVTLFVTLGK